MTAQLPLMLVPAGAVEIGEVACLVEDEAGGRVFVRGELVFAWNAGDELGRRLAAVQLVAIKGARAVRVAAGFGVNTETLRRWDNAMSQAGVVALVPGKRGPKGPSRLSHEVVADIRARRSGGASLRAIAKAVGASEASVRRAPPAVKQPGNQEVVDGAGGDDHGDAGAGEAAAADLPVLPPAADRSGERAAARWGQLVAAEPVFAPAARVPLAGLLLAIPALQATGLLPCATEVFGCLRNGFYGVELANDSPYGLAGSVWGRDIARAVEVAKRIDTGMVSINQPYSGPNALPFGGVKNSGYGREMGYEGMHEFLNHKPITLPVGTSTRYGATTEEAVVVG